MSDLAHRARRARPRLLRAALAAVLATVLTTTVAGAAMAGGTHAPMSSRTDVFTHDATDDLGFEPSQSTQPIWASPDIKVCHSALGCASSQNPIVGATNYVIVTLHNPGPYGQGISEGTLYAYYTAQGGAAVWPGDWTTIGARVVTAYPGITTVTIPWFNTPGPGHFCLLTRWWSGTDPMTFEGPNTATNTRANNNISWRNVNTVGISPGRRVPLPYRLGNVTQAKTTNDLVFTEPADRFENIGGTVIVDLGPTLFERWRKSDAQGEGIRVVGPNQIQVLDLAKGRIGGLVLLPGEHPEVTLIFSAARPPDGKFTVNVTQFGPDEKQRPNTDLGGVEYDLVPDKG